MPGEVHADPSAFSLGGVLPYLTRRPSLCIFTATACKSTG